MEDKEIREILGNLSSTYDVGYAIKKNLRERLKS